MKLHEIRIQKKMSQKEISKLTGISQNYISELESKKHEATEYIIIKLCHGLDVDPNTLLDWENIKNK